MPASPWLWQNIHLAWHNPTSTYALFQVDSVALAPAFLIAVLMYQLSTEAPYFGPSNAGSKPLSSSTYEISHLQWCVQVNAQSAPAIAPAKGEFGIPAAPVLIPDGPWKEIPGCVCAPKGFKAQGKVF